MVALSGAAVVILVISLASTRLRERAPEGLPARPRPAPGQPASPPPEDVLRSQGRIAESALDDVRRLGLLAVGGLALASVGIGWVVAGRMLRPLRVLTSTAAEIGARDLHRRLDVSGPRDELRELAVTFDGMLDRLEAAFESQRRFVSDASHELRTPLAVIRAEVDVALDDPDASGPQLRQALTAIGEAIERTRALAESLLMLSRAETPISMAPVDASDSARAALALVERIDTGPLRIETDLRPARLTGDRVLIDRLFTNLVENAARYNVEGGLLRVATGTMADCVVIEVENDGAVIETNEIDELFDRFRRRDRSRGRAAGGYGLGLSIVAAVVRTHSGSIVATPRPGGGLRVEIRLPGPASVPDAGVHITATPVGAESGT